VFQHDQVPVEWGEGKKLGNLVRLDFRLPDDGDVMGFLEVARHGQSRESAGLKMRFHQQILPGETRGRRGR